MLLTIDAGNTNTVFAIFDGKKQLGLWRSTTQVERTADEYAVFLKMMIIQADIDPKGISDAIIGSVVPDTNFSLLKLCRDHFDCEPLFVGSPEVKTGITVDIDRPTELGADRLINAVSGSDLYDTPLLIIDFGTATTFDVLDKEGHYMGGAIAPGVNLSIRALHMAAAKLPSVAVARPPSVIAKNTVDAIQSGVFWGYVGMIEGLITRMKDEFDMPMKVVATGGLARLFVNVIPQIDETNMDLTLHGLYLIHQMNKK